MINDPLDFDDDWDQAAWDEATDPCELRIDGTCGLAGSDFCNYQCPIAESIRDDEEEG